MLQIAVKKSTIMMVQGIYKRMSESAFDRAGFITTVSNVARKESGAEALRNELKSTIVKQTKLLNLEFLFSKQHRRRIFFDKRTLRK